MHYLIFIFEAHFWNLKSVYFKTIHSVIEISADKVVTFGQIQDGRRFIRKNEKYTYNSKYFLF